MSEYDAFAPIVRIAGAIMATMAAISLSWRGRTDWEPWVQKVSKGPQKVGGLISAVSIALLWTTSSPGDEDFLIRVTLTLLVATLIFLLAYEYIIYMQTFMQVDVVDGKTNPPKTANVKVVGGFWLTDVARKKIKEKHLTIQKFFAGTAYDKDAVWPRSAQALANACFIIGYIGLVSCGTIALAAVAILVSFRM